MSDPNQKPPREEKPVQSLLMETVVFAAVFFTIIWLIEGHSSIAAALGGAAIIYLIARKKPG